MSDPSGQQPGDGGQPPYGGPPPQPGGQPPYGGPPQQPGGQPPYGAPPQQPAYGAPPQQPAYGAPPQQPAYGGPPQQPAYGGPAPYGPPPTAPAKKSNVGLIIAVVLILFCVLPVGGIVGITLLGSSAKYTPTTSSDGKVSFEMAGTPNRKTTTKSSKAGPFEVESFASADGNDAFLVATYVVPGLSNVDNLGELLDAELDAIAQADSGTVNSRSNAQFQGNTARSADVTKGGVSGKCLVFAQGDRVVVACAWTTGSLQDKYQHLLDSIRVKD